MLKLDLSLPQSETRLVTYDSDDIEHPDNKINVNENEKTDDECMNNITLTTSPSNYKLMPRYHIHQDTADTVDTILSLPISSDEKSSDLDDIPISELFSKMTSTQQDIVFNQNGYKIIKKLCDTTQGELYKAEVISLSSKLSLGSFVTIKKTDKDLFKEQIAIQDDTTFCVEENIIKEAIILKHLTVDNQPQGNYIVKYIDFFESDTHFYLVMEYIGSEINLKQFVEKAHELMENGELTITEYHKTVKYIMWQLVATIRWLHDVYHCCHLDLCLENIMIQNAEFVMRDGSRQLKIHPLLSIKLCDFGVAELFPFGQDISFNCVKQDLSLENETFVSPQRYAGDIYDARKSDIWSLGIIFYQLLTNETIYDACDMWDEPQNGYSALITNKLKRWLAANGLLKNFKQTSFHLLQCLLKYNEDQRLTADQVIQHKYFQVYYQKYKRRMNRKIISDTKLLKEQSKSMSSFPFYKM